MKKLSSFLALTLLLLPAMGCNGLNLPIPKHVQEAKKAQETVEVRNAQAPEGKSGEVKIPELPDSDEFYDVKEIQRVTLTPQNTISLRTVVREKSISRLTSEVMRRDVRAKKDTPLYLVLDSPGGSVFHGMRFIDILDAVDREVKTINLFSASMAFHIAQNAGERLLPRSGLLMSHQAQLAVQGERDQVRSRLNFWLRTVDRLNARAADRMNLSFDSYIDEIRDEMWVGGANALSNNSADRIVAVKCSPEMVNSTSTQTLITLFGKVYLTFSDCPLVSYPVNIRFGDNMSFQNASQKEKLHEFIDKLFKNKRAFVEDYIVDGSFQEYLK